MTYITRSKGITFCLIMLLAAVVSSSQMLRVQASSGAAPVCPSAQFIACRKDPIAIVYHRCKENTVTKTCARIHHVYFVHNGMALVDLRPNEPASLIGHVSVWERDKIPHPQTWYICSKGRVMAVIKGTNKTPCHFDTVNGMKFYWVRDLTKTVYQSPVTIQKQSIIVKMIPIAFRIGNSSDAHDGVFVCYTNDTTCHTTIPTTLTGVLYYEHYVSPTGRQSKNKTSFKLNPRARMPGDNNTGRIQVVNLRSLTYPPAT